MKRSHEDVSNGEQPPPKMTRQNTTELIVVKNQSIVSKIKKKI